MLPLLPDVVLSLIQRILKKTPLEDCGRDTVHLLEDLGISLIEDEDDFVYTVPEGERKYLISVKGDDSQNQLIDRGRSSGDS